MKAPAITDKALKTVAVPNKHKRRGLNLNRKRAMMGYMFILPFIIGLITFFAVPLISRSYSASISWRSWKAATISYIWGPKTIEER